MKSTDGNKAGNLKVKKEQVDIVQNINFSQLGR